jgi:uncharacterized protein (DUF1697 family)
MPPKPKSKPTSTVYVALLRAINVGGKNLVSMKALKERFEELGFRDVTTYINSGNVIFRSTETDARKIEAQIDRMLEREFSVAGKTVVRSRTEMARVTKTIAQTWNGDPTWRYNVIFLRHSIDSKDVLAALQPKADIESVVYCPGTLLWSARVSDIGRTLLLKLASRPIYQDMTIRNVNTTNKVFELMQRVEKGAST